MERSTSRRPPRSRERYPSEKRSSTAGTGRPWRRRR
uniref:Uncharacterized protein n=1 Tax=Arundo donax TaxID=35708 RepID=A0A0A9HRB8_ARUDO